jgi:tRNA (guanine-N7-)-methyltransferase
VRKKTEKKNTFPTFSCSLPANPNWQGEWALRLGAPLILELGCGKASFTIAYARTFPQRYIVGIDAKSDRLYTGAKLATANQLSNVRFLKANISQITEFFGQAEVDGIWITFPDPYPKKRHADRRLTSPYFLEQYQKILKPGASLQFKTDNYALYAYTLEVLALQPVEILAQTPNLHHSPYLNTETAICTDYEAKFLTLGLATHYIHFQFKADKTGIRLSKKEENSNSIILTDKSNLE